MVAAIERGYPQKEIERRAYEHQRAVEAHERIVVGVNEYVMVDEAPVPVATIDPQLEREQCARVQATRARRTAAEHVRAIAALRDAAAGSDNVLPAILGAAKALA